MATGTDVTGSTPLSITASTGGQRVVPLSALEFVGSSVRLRQAWESAFTAAEATALLALAEARVAGGELRKPPVAPPTPALVVTATVPGPESNTISVHVTPDQTAPSPLTSPIGVSVTERDVYGGVPTATAAAAAIGTDTPPAAPTDPPLGTGLVRVKSGSIAASTKLPVDVAETALPDAGLPVKDADGNVLFTLLPRPGYSPTKGLTVQIERDTSGASFTVTAAYDSAQETTELPTFTLLSLDSLPKPVTYLVTLTSPAGGAAVPAETPSEGVRLTGGGRGLAARALLYTPTA
jgi:hypothetical protein